MITGKKEECTACGACMNVCPVTAISMKYNSGFSYPQVDEELCIRCGLCGSVCQAENENGAAKRNSKENQLVYACKNTDQEVRESCASGGVFEALASWILRRNGTVYGAVFDKTFQVVHVRAEGYSTGKPSAEYNPLIQIKRMMGSKYPQSDIGFCFRHVKQDLKERREVLFCGLPCQIDGLRRYLGNGTDTERLFLADLICHGVMSPEIFSAFIEKLEKRFHCRLKDFSFREKEHGWLNQRWGYEMGNGARRVDDTDLLKLKKLYYGGFCSRPSCYKCHFANLNRPGDLTLGDYWGIDQANSTFRDSLGVSCVLVNSEKGKNLLKRAAEGRMEILQTEKRFCMQQQLQKPAKAAAQREEFWRICSEQSFETAFDKFGKLNMKSELKSKIPIKIRERLKQL